MRGNSVTYAQLLETNNLIQVFADESYWLCLTWTTQQSKLFPVPAYMLLSYLNAYYRYPSLLRKVETRMSAEECGDRARNMGTKTDTLNMGWCVPGFYLMGREVLINLGLLRPEDGVEDAIYVMDFWKRIQLSYHRNDGHMTNKEFGHRSQFLPERTLQVFEADLVAHQPRPADVGRIQRRCARLHARGLHRPVPVLGRFLDQVPLGPPRGAGAVSPRTAGTRASCADAARG